MAKLDLVLAFKDAICVQLWIVAQYKHRCAKKKWLQTLEDCDYTPRAEAYCNRLNRTAESLHEDAVQKLATAEQYMGTKLQEGGMYSHSHNEELEDALWQEMAAAGVGITDFVGQDKFDSIRKEVEALLDPK